MNRSALCLFLAGCFGGAPDEIEEQDLPKYTARIVCSRLRECDRAFYDSTYFGKSDCRDSWERAVEDIADAASDVGCDYSAADAGQAWEDIADLSCEDFVEGGSEDALLDIWGDCF